MVNQEIFSYNSIMIHLNDKLTVKVNYYNSLLQ